MPSITLSVLKGLYTLYRPSSSVPEFGYSGAPKPFGYLFEYAELALGVLERPYPVFEYPKRMRV